MHCDEFIQTLQVCIHAIGIMLITVIYSLFEWIFAKLYWNKYIPLNNNINRYKETHMISL